MLFYNAQIYNDISIVIKIKSMRVGGGGSQLITFDIPSET